MLLPGLTKPLREMVLIALSLRCVADRYYIRLATRARACPLVSVVRSMLMASRGNDLVKGVVTA